MCSANPHPSHLGLIQSLRVISQPTYYRRSSIHYGPVLGSTSSFNPCGANLRCSPRKSLVHVAEAMDEDLGDASFSLEGDNGGFEGSSGYLISSSDGDDSDIDAFLTPFADTELPLRRERFETPDAALTLSAHRLATIQRGYRKNRTRRGVILTLGLTTSMALLFLFIDWCAWKIVRLPLEPFYLTYPFAVSAFSTVCIGFLFVAIVDSLKIHQIIRRDGYINSPKIAIPTIGGLFFIPVGIITARAIVGHLSIHVNGVAAATLGFTAIGLLDDIFRFAKNYKHNLPGWLKLLLHVAVGTWFSIWLELTNLPTPYNMYTSSLSYDQRFLRLLVPLPPPYGLVQLGKFYPLLTIFCFASMPNSVHLTDGADGLVGGVSALAFVGMSIAVLPICPELAVYGASMAGASLGFLFHNRYKASILMGSVGSLGMAGALSAMAACTGMFLPLFISSGVFIIEALSVVLQIPLINRPPVNCTVASFSCFSPSPACLREMATGSASISPLSFRTTKACPPSGKARCNSILFSSSRIPTKTHPKSASTSLISSPMLKSHRSAIKSLFTGIVEEVGQIQHLGPNQEGGIELRIAAKTVLGGIQLGDSISVNGTCLTVSEFNPMASNFSVGLSPETLRKTSLSELGPSSPVNLERALQPISRMGGHFVQGHIDGTGEITKFEPEGDSLWVKVNTSPELLRYIVPKGFISVDGVSLTVVRVYDEDSCFDFMLVSYTQQKVTIPMKKVGDKVNLEVDILGKYVEKLLRSRVGSEITASSY